jgi:hypothetical protein
MLFIFTQGMRLDSCPGRGPLLRPNESTYCAVDGLMRGSIDTRLTIALNG